MSTPDGELRGRAGPDRRRAALLGTAAVLAALAAAAVVLADDARWLRLGIVAALWAAVVAGIVVARHTRAASGAAEAQEAAADLAAARDEAEEKLAALHRDHDLRLAREVAAREESEQAAEQAREDAASLRVELERLRAAPRDEAVTLQSAGLPVGPPPTAAIPSAPPRQRGARLRVVGDSGPLPAGPATPVPPPAPLRPAMADAPAPRTAGVPIGRRPVTTDRSAAARAVPPPPPRPEVAPATGDPAVLTTGSYVDQYVRDAGYEPPAEPTPERSGRRAASGESSGTGGRTVAELLAAHAATAGGTGGRRRREP